MELLAAEVARIVGQARRRADLTRAAAADERNQIARELHDSVSQTLYSIAMVADVLPTTLQRDPAVATDQARRIRSMTLDALGEVRLMLSDMRDTALGPASLGGLVEQLASPVGGLVVVEADVGGEVDLAPAAKLAAYRIAQEALTNARRHASASRILVRLEQRGGVTTLWVEDDGTGFEAAAASHSGHGLRIMRERAEEIGAELTIESAPGRGTVVRFSWPRAVGRSTTTAEGT
jgi:signal transduction histidine kinase